MKHIHSVDKCTGASPQEERYRHHDEGENRNSPEARQCHQQWAADDSGDGAACVHRDIGEGGNGSALGGGERLKAFDENRKRHAADEVGGEQDGTCHHDRGAEGEYRVSDEINEEANTKQPTVPNAAQDGRATHRTQSVADTDDHNGDPNLGLGEAEAGGEPRGDERHDGEVAGLENEVRKEVQTCFRGRKN